MNMMELMYASSAPSSNSEPFFSRDIFDGSVDGSVDVNIQCNGGCAFSVLIDNYAVAPYDVCGISRVSGWSRRYDEDELTAEEWSEDWMLYLQRRGPGNLEIETMDGSEGFQTDDVEDGNRHHIIVNATTASPTALGTIQVFVDGVSIDLREGRTFFYDGTILQVRSDIQVRNFRVWNRALSAAEIIAEYQYGTTGVI